MLGQQDISVLEYEQGVGSQMPLLPPLSSVVSEASTCPAQETFSPFPKVASQRAPPAPIEQTTLSVNSNSLPQPHAHTSIKTALGPYTPTLILHGGSGSITRAKLPPALYAEYRASLLTYLQSTHEKLKAGASALDTACHAVSLMEDDPLFNCGRGSVFTEKGTIEMEASVMVSSVRNEGDGANALPGAGVPAKRGASVSLIKGTRHPVMLAREVLLAGGDGLGGVGTMHCQLSGPDVEKWGWNEKGLERKGPEWFWTRKRWKEHLRDLEKQMTEKQSTSPGQCSMSFDGANVENWAVTDPYSPSGVGAFEDVDDLDYPSQGTVGAVCMDSRGNLAIATSTGGLTNKKAGRIGDTPTVGAGFWAESWEEDGTEQAGQTQALSRCQFDERQLTFTQRLARALDAGFGDILQDCLQPLSLPADDSQETLLPPDHRTERQLLVEKDQPLCIPQTTLSGPPPSNLPMALLPRRRAVALGGTGNGDSFLRTAAVRTTAAKCRFGSRPDKPVTLAEAVTNVAGPGGELQQSAGDRWQKTFEGQGGIIGIELFANEKEGKVVFDFNCGGMWRAWIDEQTGESRVMVFKAEYGA